LRYNWPGNVRELENIISRAVLKASQQQSANSILQIKPEHLAGDLGSAMYVQPVQNVPESRDEMVSFRDEVSRFQIHLIQSALKKNNGNWAAAARDLDMNRSNLHNLATRLGIRQKKISR
jgi:anaerobic nitric oxide reductase transcription regulator